MALRYDLSVTGVQNVKAALGQIEAEMRRHNARVTRTMGTARGGASGGRAASPEGIAAREAAAAERLQAKEQARKLRDIEKAQRAQIRADEEAVKRKERAEQALSRRRLARFKAETLKQNRLAESSQQAMRGGFARGATAPLSAVGSTAKMALGLGASYVVGSSVAKQMNVERQAAALANKAYGVPGEGRSREQIKASLMAQSEAVGGKTGNRSGLIEAVDKFVAISGSLRGGQDLGQFMADISDATGADMADVGKTGGQILQNIVATKNRDLADPEQFRQSMDEVREIMAAMAGHAKIGSIEFADLATQMGKVMSATSRYSGDVGDLANQMGAISQLAIAGGASSPEEAMTAIMRMSDDLVQNAERFDKMLEKEKDVQKLGGARSFFTDESKTKLRDPTEIMMDILRVTQGDLTKVMKVFGIRAMKALEPFQQAYVTAKQGGATDDEAIELVQKTIDRFKGSGMSQGEIAESADFARSQRGRKFQAVWEDMQMKVGAELTPVLDELIPSFIELAKLLKEAAPYLSAFLKALAKNPMLMGGSLLAGRMALGAGQGMLIGAGQGILGGGGGAANGAASAAAGGGTVTFGGKTLPVNVVNSAMLGSAIGGAVASAIYTWGTTEVERRDSETDDIVKRAKLSDPVKAYEDAKERLGKIREEKSGIKGWSDFIGDTLGGMLPGSSQVNKKAARDITGTAAGLLDFLSPQRNLDEQSMVNAMETAEKRAKEAQLLEQLNMSAEDTIVSFKRMAQEMDKFKAPNRSDKPSLVKEGP